MKTDSAMLLPGAHIPDQDTFEEDVVAARDGDEKAMSRVLAAMDRLVAFVARRRLASREMFNLHGEDLVQVGRIGVMRGVSKFDPSKTTGKAQSYIMLWAGSEIDRELERCALVPIKNQNTWKSRMEALTSTIPLNVSPHDEDATEGERNLGVMDLEDESPLQDEFVSDLYDWKVFMRLVRKMRPRHQEIIRLRIQEERSLSEIGELWGVSRERARQIEVQAMDSLAKLSRRELDLDVTGEFIRAAIRGRKDS